MPAAYPESRHAPIAARGFVPPLAAAVSLFSVTALIWAPMALRWPLRGLFVLGLLAIGWNATSRFRRRAESGLSPLRALAPALGTVLVTGLILFAGKPNWDLIRGQAGGGIRTPSDTAVAERATDLAGKLRPHGIQLAVVAMPTYRNLFPAARPSNQLPDPIERRHVRQALENLRRAGIPAYDADELFRLHAGAPSLWEDDTYHIRQEPMTRLAEALADQLQEEKLGPGADGGRKVVFMGNCFAGDFAELARKGRPEWSRLRGLSALGDESRVADLLFLFPAEYLDQTGLVIWMMHYPWLTADRFPPIEDQPDLAMGKPRTVNLRVRTALGWEEAAQASRAATLPYPNGLVHLSGTVRDGAGFPAGGTVHFIGYGVTDRQVTPLGRVKPGKRLSVNLLPLDAYLARHPKVASEYRLNAGPDDPDAPVYWLHSWTLIP